MVCQPKPLRGRRYHRLPKLLPALIFITCACERDGHLWCRSRGRPESAPGWVRHPAPQKVCGGPSSLGFQIVHYSGCAVVTAALKVKIRSTDVHTVALRTASSNRVRPRPGHTLSRDGESVTRLYRETISIVSSRLRRSAAMARASDVSPAAQHMGESVAREYDRQRVSRDGETLFRLGRGIVCR